MIDYDEIKNRRTALLLSGGVDSSVVLYEMVSHGLRPDCFYIKIGPEEKEEWNCTSEEDLEMATAMTARFGCKLDVVDCHKEYWGQVTRYTMEKVKAGYTPNPDVMCNRLIKFGAFDEKMGHGYDLIATGHYAQTEWIDGRKWLTTSPDPVKDQTDFLAQIEGWQLRKALFPIGHFEKNEVREIAEREHLINAKRRDSQGICFLGNIDYNEYVRRYLGAQGAVVPHHRAAQGLGLRRRSVVCREEGSGTEYPLRQPRLRPGNSLQADVQCARLPCHNVLSRWHRTAGTSPPRHVQNTPHARISAGCNRTDGRQYLYYPCRQ